MFGASERVPVEEIHSVRLLELSVLVQNEANFAAWVTFPGYLCPPTCDKAFIT